MADDELETLKCANGAMRAGCLSCIRFIRELGKECQIPDYMTEPQCEHIADIVRQFSLEGLPELSAYLRKDNAAQLK